MLTTDSMEKIDIFKNLLEKLCDESKFIREKAISELINFTKNLKNNEIEFFLELCLEKPVVEWSKTMGNLHAIDILLMSFNDTACGKRLIEYLWENFYHSEYRIRIKVGELLARLAVKNNIFENITVKDLLQKCILASLKANIKNDIDFESNEWKFYETTLKFLSKLFATLYTHELSVELSIDLNNVLPLFSHKNRFVREAAFHLLSNIIKCQAKVKHLITNYDCNEITNIIVKGLSDNWSQVRYVASECARIFLIECVSIENVDHSEHFERLLPRICLNRYYLAEGVRIYNQITWESVTKGQGKALVEQYLPSFIECYEEASMADNHAVREAACLCISELANKIDKSILEPYAIKLIKTLLKCFKDDSWPVRDMACVACGNFIQAYPTHSKDYMTEFYPAILANLGDPIHSVRQGAAMSLAKIASAFGMDSLQYLKPIMLDYIDNLQNAPLSSFKPGRNIVESQSTTTSLNKTCQTFSQFGVVKTIVPSKLNQPNPTSDINLENVVDDDVLHTNQVMYSCGSLAPKMRKAGGCCDTSFQRPSQPWERVDGVILFLYELVKLFDPLSLTDNMQLPQKDAQEFIQQIFPQLLSSCERNDYGQHFNLLSTFMLHVLAITKFAYTKQALKSYLNQFFALIFHVLNSDHINSKRIANELLKSLADYFGPNILRGRLEIYNPNYVKVFDEIWTPP